MHKFGLISFFFVSLHGNLNYCIMLINNNEYFDIKKNCEIGKML